MKREEKASILTGVENAINAATSLLSATLTESDAVLDGLHLARAKDKIWRAVTSLREAGKSIKEKKDGIGA